MLSGHRLAGGSSVQAASPAAPGSGEGATILHPRLGSARTVSRAALTAEGDFGDLQVYVEEAGLET